MFEMANIASKFSILCLYRRIFATANFRRWTLLVFALCICWFLSSILVTIFYCIPVSDYWNPTTATPRCIDTYKFIMGYEIGNMLCDIAILALPLRMVALLQLDIAQKTMLSGVFLLGGLYGTPPPQEREQFAIVVYFANYSSFAVCALHLFFEYITPTVART